MKKTISLILAITLIFTALPVMLAYAQGQTYYIDSVSGDDKNTGTSESSAWKTVENLRSLSPDAGDKILFKCDGIYNVNELIFNCSGTKEAPVVISSYGNGNKPLLTTSEAKDILVLNDCSYVTVSNLEMTAHNGGGIFITVKNSDSNGITLDGLIIHDIQNYPVNNRDSYSNATKARACVVINNLSSDPVYTLNDFTATNCEMYDCGNGLILWAGVSKNRPGSEDPDIIHGKNAYIADCYFHDMDAEALLMGTVENIHVTNCSAINCSQGLGVDENGEILYYIAPVWFWGGLNGLVEHCEIAGAKNIGDAMSVDFDSWTDSCTYQYIYSHDNMRFICNNPYGKRGQHNNTVRYCLSVNDFGGKNHLSIRETEYGLKFYNNTVVGCSDFYMTYTKNATVVNNIIIPATGYRVIGENSIFAGMNISHNCYMNCLNPRLDLFSLNTDPCFAGNDMTDPKSFELSANSPLIGAGVKIDDGLTKDFFGNDITNANIGCYGGNGVGTVDPDYGKETIYEKFMRITNYILTALAEKTAEIFGKKAPTC